MALLELLIVGVGTGIAKGALKLWLQDSSLAGEAGKSIVDVLSGKTKDLLAHRSANRQLERIGERVATSLLPLYEAERIRISEGGLASVAIAAGETINSSPLTVDVLLSHDLDPVRLERIFARYESVATRDFGEAEQSLYRRTIKEACQFIVDLAATFPTFTEASLTEVLRRETALIDRADQIIDEVRRIRTVVDTEHIKTAQFETEYRRAVSRRLDRIELFGVDVSNSSRRYKLSVAYVSLSLGTPVDEKSAPHIAAEISTESDVLPVNQILCDHKRLFIVGSAGSGKTTLLQWIAVQAASNMFANELDAWNGNIPYFIRLREYADKSLPVPEEFPRSVAPAITGEMPPRWVHDRLKSGSAIVLIDGIDELPSPRREKMSEWLADLMDSFPDARYIVTSRPHAVDHHIAPGCGFRSAFLQDMTIMDIEAFIDHWHLAISDEEQSAQAKEQLEELRHNLRMVIRTNRQIRKLAQTPLLCAMICALHRDRTRQLPLDRVELYRACIEMFFRRDTERDVPLSEYPTLTSRQKTAILSDLAYWLVKNGWSEINLQKVDHRIYTKLKNMGRNANQTTGASVRRLFVERTGILREPIPNQVDFPHRTFQEFLAAQAALEEGDLGVLVQNAQNDQWREVILLAAGLAREDEASTLISSIVDRGDRESEHRHQMYLLGVGCSEMAVTIEPEIRVLAEERIRRIIPPKSLTGAHELAGLGSVVVPFLYPNPKWNVRETASCIRTLAVLGGEEALAVLSAYVSDSRSGVRDALLESAKHADVPEDYGKAVLFDRSSISMMGRFSLDLFRHLENLSYLYLELNATPRVDLTQLVGLVNLKELALRFWWTYFGPYGVDLEPLTRLQNLQALDLSQAFSVVNISPLARLPRLKYLSLAGTGVRDLSPLANFPALEAVCLPLGVRKPTFLRQRKIRVVSNYHRSKYTRLFPREVLQQARIP